ncbi:MAG TPA: 50S ribosomal protein L24 [Elusimicrobia bacterium]|nr:MAG: 50S ribosomal protein L24 [Elusimicrobia bacterium GWA2_66_18]OGR73867.1 MAG: 50S ribosomal protein L24 [Elusimicrobia bacterium GWC2_65_9]HAZ07322.1 50S ribosomal protein L24 [Elusimicrobiota bacterium]
MKFKIKKKDKVVVISGKDKGKVGEVIEVISGDGFTPARVLITKINIVTKHQKPTQTDRGGLVKMEAPISISKVMLADPKTNKPTRVKFKTLPNGDKIRVALKSGETIV